MYVRVADAIREAGLSGSRHPTDYLNFFCLAKREGPDDLAQMGFVDPEPGTAAEEVRRSRRHPIYVHSKMTVCLFISGARSATTDQWLILTRLRGMGDGFWENS